MWNAAKSLAYHTYICEECKQAPAEPQTHRILRPYLTFLSRSNHNFCLNCCEPFLRVASGPNQIPNKRFVPQASDVGIWSLLCLEIPLLAPFSDPANLDS
jgi:hypothetical protein